MRFNFWYLSKYFLAFSPAVSIGSSGIVIFKPFHYVSSDGYHIYVGKNNYQNEELTFKFATGNDGLHAVAIRIQQLAIHAVSLSLVRILKLFDLQQPAEYAAVQLSSYEEGQRRRFECISALLEYYYAAAAGSLRAALLPSPLGNTKAAPLCPVSLV